MNTEFRRWFDNDVKFPTSISTIFPILVTLFSAYIIIGGIWEGETASFGELHPGVVYLMLAGAIFLIGGLEGLQISVSSLYRKDLDEVSDLYPRGYELHQRFRMDEEQVQRFFAGRQLLIVAVVFLASRFTTFPTMSEFPIINLPIPSLLTPWFQIIFLSFGLLGALFVYWFGNLTSQLIATQYPVAFLDIPGMSLLFSTCLFIDQIHLPRTSKFLASKISPKIAPDGGEEYSSRIPLSAEQKYRRELESDSGFVISTISEAWRFGKHQLEIGYKATYEIGRDGISTLKDGNFNIPQFLAPKNLNFAAILERDGESKKPEYLTQKLVDQTFGEYTEFTLFATDPIGEFEVGDKITFYLSLNFDTTPIQFSSDQLRIDHPASSVHLYIDFDKDAYELDSPILNITNPVHPQTVGTTPAKAKKLELIDLDDGVVYAEHLEEYPKQGSVYNLEWNASFKSRPDSTVIERADQIHSEDAED